MKELMMMVDMKWRIRRKFYFKRSGIQALPLTWMGREMEYLIRMRLRFNPLT
jgi:hypothetical protein